MTYVAETKNRIRQRRRQEGGLQSAEPGWATLREAIATKDPILPGRITSPKTTVGKKKENPKSE